MARPSLAPICGGDALEHLAWHGVVERERHDGLAAGFGASDLGGGDVDAGLAETGADGADHARAVGVAEERHVRRGLDVDGGVPHLDQPLA